MLISYEMKSAGSNRRFYDDIARPLRIYRTLKNFIISALRT
jgi:hypothetical protein